MKIKIKVITNSSRQQIEKISENEYKVRLKSAPVEGKANQELIEILSKFFNIPKSLIEVVKGQTSKNKVIEIKK
jgi:uncharacterized protein